MGEEVRRIFAEQEIFGLVLKGRGKFSWFQVTEIPFRWNRDYIGRLDVTLGRAGVLWLQMFLGPSLHAHLGALCTSVSFSYFRWAANWAAAPSPPHVLQLHHQRGTNPISSESVCKILETEARPTTELVSKDHITQTHHTSPWPLENKPCIGHSQNRGTLGIQTTIPRRDIGSPKDSRAGVSS